MLIGDNVGLLFFFWGKICFLNLFYTKIISIFNKAYPRFKPNKNLIKSKDNPPEADQ